jgi:putative spermidine/putrescine transport system permease protein
MTELSLGLRLYVGAMIVFLLAPLLIVIAVSFSASPFMVFPPTGVSLRWFVKVLNAPDFMGPLWNSLVLGVLSTLVAALLAIPAALALARGLVPGARELEAFFLSPLSLPGIILGTGLLFFTSRIGIGGSFLALLAGHVVVTVPYLVRTVLAVYRGVNREIEEAAAVCGAGPFASFFLITLPMIRPGILAGGIFAFLISFDEVPVALFLSNTETVTLPVSVLSYLVNNYDPAVAAISTIQIVIVVALLLVLERVIGVRRLVSIGEGRA